MRARRRGLFSDVALDGRGREQSRLARSGASSRTRTQALQTSSRKASSAMRSAMSSSTSVRCTARAIPANATGTHCFLSRIERGEVGRRQRKRESHGSSACIFRVAAGFATMACWSSVITALLAKLTPRWVGERRKRPARLHVCQSRVFVSGCGSRGYVTAWVAEHDPLVHVLALAIAVLLAGCAERASATR